MVPAVSRWGYEGLIVLWPIHVAHNAQIVDVYHHKSPRCPGQQLINAVAPLSFNESLHQIRSSKHRMALAAAVAG